MAKTRLTSGRRKTLNNLEFISTLLELIAEYQVEDILRVIVNEIPSLVNAKEASLFWLDRENDRIVLRATYDQNRQNIGNRWYAIGEGLTGWVARTGKPLRIKDITDQSELKRIDPGLRWSDKYKSFQNAKGAAKSCRKSFLAIPIKMDGITMGVLRLTKTERAKKRFSYQDERLMLSFARLLSAFLKKAHIFEKVENLKDLIQPALIKKPKDLETYLREVVNLIPTVLNSAGCTIYLKEHNSEAYVLRYVSRGNPLEKSIGIAKYNKDEGVTGWVLRNARTVRLNDIQNEDELRSIDPNLKWIGKHTEFLVAHSNYMATPIVIDNEVYGVIRVSKDAQGIPFSQNDERLLEMYGGFVASSLRSLQLYKDSSVATTQKDMMQIKPKWKGRYDSNKNYCYVLMPFTKKWSANVRLAIQQAVERIGIEFRIADEQTGRIVMEDVWRGICEARIIIADLSSANANVAYEVGLADVLGKDVILLSQDAKAVPTDLKGDRLLVYSASNIDKLADLLIKRIKDVSNPLNNLLPSSFLLEKDGSLKVSPKFLGRHVVNNACCCILVPSRKAWAANIKHTIRLAVESTKLDGVFAEEGNGAITIDDKWKGISEACILIADLSTGDPDIAYEIGLADALGKEVVLLAQNEKQVPFDFSSKRLLLYHPDNLKLLHEKLCESLQRVSNYQ